jgi:hypothetical protein
MTSRGVLAVSAAVLALSLAACGSSSSTNASSSKATDAPGSSAPAEQSKAADPSSDAAAPKSDIQTAVDKAVAALDQLGIKHTAPTRTPVGGSGAKAIFGIKIDGYGAGINVFPSVAALNSWQKLSDQFGGVDVTFGSTAISLNSQKGINDSVKVAPKLAQALGGETHGV